MIIRSGLKANKTLLTEQPSYLPVLKKVENKGSVNL